MPREYGKLEIILQSIVDRIIDQLVEATTANTYINFDPDATSNPGKFVFVVAPAGGTFDEAMIDGGGNAQATSTTNIVVKIHSPDQRDQAGRGNTSLIDSTTGLTLVHRKLLRALVAFDPVDDDGNEQCRNPLMPGQFTYQRATQAGQGPRSYSAVEQVFVADFDWNLNETIVFEDGDTEVEMVVSDDGSGTEELELNDG
jgi:hypothetical protein